MAVLEVIRHERATDAVRGVLEFLVKDIAVGDEVIISDREHKDDKNPRQVMRMKVEAEDRIRVLVYTVPCEGSSDARSDY